MSQRCFPTSDCRSGLLLLSPRDLMLLLLHLVPYVRVVSYRYIFIYLLAFLASLPVPVVSVNSIMGLISFPSLILFFLLPLRSPFPQILLSHNFSSCLVALVFPRRAAFHLIPCPSACILLKLDNICDHFMYVYTPPHSLSILISCPSFHVHVSGLGLLSYSTGWFFGILITHRIYYCVYFRNFISPEDRRN